MNDQECSRETSERLRGEGWRCREVVGLQDSKLEPIGPIDEFEVGTY